MKVTDFVGHSSKLSVQELDSLVTGALKERRYIFIRETKNDGSLYFTIRGEESDSGRDLVGVSLREIIWDLSMVTGDKQHADEKFLSQFSCAILPDYDRFNNQEKVVAQSIMSYVRHVVEEAENPQDEYVSPLDVLSYTEAKRVIDEEIASYISEFYDCKVEVLNIGDSYIYTLSHSYWFDFFPPNETIRFKFCRIKIYPTIEDLWIWEFKSIQDDEAIDILRSRTSQLSQRPKSLKLPGFSKESNEIFGRINTKWESLAKYKKSLGSTKINFKSWISQRALLFKQIKDDNPKLRQEDVARIAQDKEWDVINEGLRKDNPNWDEYKLEIETDGLFEDKWRKSNFTKEDVRNDFRKMNWDWIKGKKIR